MKAARQLLSGTSNMQRPDFVAGFGVWYWRMVIRSRDRMG